MNGHLDSAGRALVRITVKSTATAPVMTVDAWVDTGFTGELVLPHDKIATLGLSRSAVVKAELGDGSETMLDVYTCLIEWFGQEQQIEVIAGAGKFPLLGIGLLQGHTLTVHYASRTLTIRVTGAHFAFGAPRSSPALKDRSTIIRRYAAEQLRTKNFLLTTDY